MKVYLAGPMSGITDFNYPAFHDAAEGLTLAGYEPVSPAGDLIDNWEWSDYMRRSLALMLTADEVALMDGWSESRGARIERDLAVNLRMPTRPLSDYLDGTR